MFTIVLLMTKLDTLGI